MSWYALDSAPVLRRRWRWYLDWFRRPAGDRTLVWQRQRRAYLPTAVAQWRWWLPDPLFGLAGQEVIDRAPWLGGRRQVELDGGRLVEGGEASPGPDAADDAAAIVLRASATVRLRPQPAPAELLEFAGEELVAALVAFTTDFVYGYRHHRHADQWSATSGSCLDAALGFAGTARLPAGRWRLDAGLLPDDRIGNPHYWLAWSPDGGSWLQVDPSVPAIARMLGEPVEPWAARSVGGFDARRLVLASTALPAAAVRWPTLADGYRGFVSSSPGELAVTTGGVWHSAWACQDWVCGVTRDSFMVA